MKQISDDLLQTSAHTLPSSNQKEMLTKASSEAVPCSSSPGSVSEMFRDVEGCLRSDYFSQNITDCAKQVYDHGAA